MWGRETNLAASRPEPTRLPTSTASSGYRRLMATSDLDAMNESGDYNDDIAAKLKGICDGFAEKGAY